LVEGQKHEQDARIEELEKLLREEKEETSRLKGQQQLYEDFSCKLLETEQRIDSMVQEKERKENELVKKLGAMAENHHKEKQRCQNLMSEITTQNETLSRIDKQFRQLEKDKESLKYDNERLKEEVNFLRQGVDKKAEQKKYLSFVQELCETRGDDSQKHETEVKEYPEQPKSIAKSDSFSKLLKNFAYY